MPEFEKPKVVVLKRPVGADAFWPMWQAWCEGCPFHCQYHFYGAALGEALIHRQLGCSLERTRDEQRNRVTSKVPIPPHGAALRNKQVDRGSSERRDDLLRYLPSRDQVAARLARERQAPFAEQVFYIEG